MSKYDIIGLLSQMEQEDWLFIGYTFRPEYDDEECVIIVMRQGEAQVRKEK